MTTNKQNQKKKSLKAEIDWIKSFPAFDEIRPVAYSFLLPQILKENDKLEEKFNKRNLHKAAHRICFNDLNRLKASISGDFDVFYDLYGSRIETYPIRDDIIEYIKESIQKIESYVASRKDEKVKQKGCGKENGSLSSSKKTLSIGEKNTEVRFKKKRRVLEV